MDGKADAFECKPQCCHASDGNTTPRRRLPAFVDELNNAIVLLLLILKMVIMRIIRVISIVFTLLFYIMLIMAFIALMRIITIIAIIAYVCVVGWLDSVGSRVVYELESAA